MMNRKIIILFLIATGLLTACQKNLDLFVPDAGQLSGPDTSWYGTITASMPVSDLKNKLMIETYKDSIQVSSNTSYISDPSGLQCYFPPNCCITNGGVIATGSAKLELGHIKTKGDMIRMQRPTISNGRLLVNANQLFVRLKNETGDLSLAPGIRITLRFADLPVNTQMKFFVGDESNTAQFNWLPNPDPVNNTLGITPTNYEIQTNHLRWVSANYFYDTTGIARVKVKAELASYFTNSNTIAYTVFRDFRSVVGMYGDVNSRKFSTGLLPVGKQVTVVVISKQGNDFFIGSQNVTTATSASNPGEQTVAVTPVKKSLAEIISFLNTL